MKTCTVSVWGIFTGSGALCYADSLAVMIWKDTGAQKVDWVGWITLSVQSLSSSLQACTLPMEKLSQGCPQFEEVVLPMCRDQCLMNSE